MKNLPKTISDIINDYFLEHKQNEEIEKDWFKNMKSIDDVIYFASYALDHRKKKLHHQQRLPKKTSELIYKTLIKNKLKISNINRFESLYDLIESLISEIYGCGELMIYDTALRISNYIKIEPNTLYIHAGVRTGLINLNCDYKAKKITKKDLPPEFKNLNYIDIENIICIYKDSFKSRIIKKNIYC